MAGLLFFLILIAGLVTLGSFLARRGGMRVHDSTGRTIALGPPAGLVNCRSRYRWSCVSI